MASNGFDDGIIEILSKLDEDILLSLGKTVTQGLLKINSTDEAVKGILKYSPDKVSILRRKSVTRDILFSYLDEKNIELKLPITKNELIDKILEYWNISSSSTSNHYSDQTVSCKNNVKDVKDKKQNEDNEDDDHSVSALAKQFTIWFYGLLNNNNIGVENFYLDAKLKINIFSNNDCQSIVVENDPENIVQELFKIKLQHNLYFNPNISKEGTQGRMNPHGLVMVLVCGTLHVQETCVGVFEQVFALARDPFCDNNWKIKNSEINLRSKSVIGQPSLCESELTSEYLQLPSS